MLLLSKFSWNQRWPSQFHVIPDVFHVNYNYLSCIGIGVCRESWLADFRVDEMSKAYKRRVHLRWQRAGLPLLVSLLISLLVLFVITYLYYLKIFQFIIILLVQLFHILYFNLYLLSKNIHVLNWIVSNREITFWVHFK